MATNFLGLVNGLPVPGYSDDIDTPSLDVGSNFSYLSGGLSSPSNQAFFQPFRGWTSAVHPFGPSQFQYEDRSNPTNFREQSQTAYINNSSSSTVEYASESSISHNIYSEPTLRQPLEDSFNPLYQNQGFPDGIPPSGPLERDSDTCFGLDSSPSTFGQVPVLPMPYQTQTRVNTFQQTCDQFSSFSSAPLQSESTSRNVNINSPRSSQDYWGAGASAAVATGIFAPSGGGENQEFVAAGAGGESCAAAHSSEAHFAGGSTLAPLASGYSGGVGVGNTIISDPWLNPTPSFHPRLNRISLSGPASSLHPFHFNHNQVAVASALSDPTYPFLIADQHNVTSPRCDSELMSTDYLAVLAEGNFTSPSLPPLRSSSPPLPDSAIPPISVAVDYTNNSTMPRGSTGTSAERTAASTRVRRSSRSSVASATDLITSPKLERENSEASPSADVEMIMAPPSTTRKRTRTSVTSMSAAPPRRDSSSTKSRPVKPLKGASTAANSTPLENDAFDAFIALDDDGDGDVLDLTNPEAAVASPPKPKVDNRVKLSKFQCVICMDDVANLTVTHCGHLFCSECLHSSLHIDSVKKTCPVCRTKVDVKAKSGARQSKNTFYHLELKLMTANRKGKRPVER
ncbi:hypothetical protein BX600DRAFT_226325 [Xylariales sp. PMI_506]|nr:hypothetical protein BX600DRAFT_226325 [Xylariales sp. PMI_506]